VEDIVALSAAQRGVTTGGRCCVVGRRRPLSLYNNNGTVLALNVGKRLHLLK